MVYLLSVIKFDMLIFFYNYESTFYFVIITRYCGNPSDLYVAFSMSESQSSINDQ